MDLFLCDYGEGCHPNILKALERTNLSRPTAMAWIPTAIIPAHTHQRGLSGPGG